MIHIMKTKSSTRVDNANANAPTAQLETRLRLRVVEVAEAREFDRAVLRAVERQIDDGLAARVRCWRQQAPASATIRNQLAAIRVAPARTTNGARGRRRHGNRRRRHRRLDRQRFAQRRATIGRHFGLVCSARDVNTEANAH